MDFIFKNLTFGAQSVGNGSAGCVCLALLYGPPGTLFYDSNWAQWDKMCNELISESTGPISTVKKTYESLRTSYMHYGTFYAQAPLGAKRPRGPIYTAITGPIFTIQKLYEMMHVDSVISSRRLESYMKFPALQI